jgi:hypothetical protein
VTPTRHRPTTSRLIKSLPPQIRIFPFVSLREKRFAGRLAEALRECFVPLRASLQSNGSFADLDSLVEHPGQGAPIALAIGKRPRKRRSSVLARLQINRLLLGPVKIPPAHSWPKGER